MREIRFRGLSAIDQPMACVGEGEMVYGSLVINGNSVVIITDDGQDVSIDPKTLCQYTGLTSHDGVEVYEGDHLAIGKSNFLVVFSDGCFVVNDIFDDTSLADTVKSWDVEDKGFDEYSRKYFTVRQE